MLIKVNELWDKNSEYFDFGVRELGFKRIRDRGFITVVENEGINYVDLGQVQAYVEYEDDFIDEYFIDLEVWDLLGYNLPKDSLRSNQIKRLEKLAKDGYIQMVNLDFPLVTQSVRDPKYSNIRRFFQKQSIYEFLEEYITLEEARKLLGMAQLSTTINKLNEYNVHHIKITNKHNMTFVNKKEMVDFVEEYNKPKLFSDEFYFSHSQTLEYLEINSAALNGFIKLGLVNEGIRKHGTVTMFRKKDVIEFKERRIEEEKELVENHYIDYEVFKLLDYPEFAISGRSHHRARLIKLVNEGYLEMIVLNYPLQYYKEDKYKHSFHYFSKESVHRFIDEHINLLRAHETLNRYRNIESTRQNLKRLKIKMIEFRWEYKWTFVRKNDIYLAKKLIPQRYEKISEKMKKEDDMEKEQLRGYIRSKKALEILEITRKRLTKLIKIGLISSRKSKYNHLYLKEDEVLEFKRKRDLLYKKVSEKWYVRNEVEEKYSINVDSYRIKKIKVPLTIRGFKKFKMKDVMFCKNSVKEIHEERIMNELYNQDVGSISENIQHRLKLEKIRYEEETKNTLDLWHVFMERKSREWNPNSDDDKIQRINIMVNVTKLLTNHLDKEIYLYTSNELNLLFFNNKVHRHFQIQLYTFLSELYSASQYYTRVRYDVNKLNNPYQRKQKKRTKEIYSVDEYNLFFHYVSDNYEKHKAKAISDIRQALNETEGMVVKRENYNGYDSAWLYVLLHLTNLWRAPDFLTLPRVTFDNTAIEPTIQWIESNDISFEDAKVLLKRVQIKIHRFSKNDRKRYLTIPDQLLLPFAYALTLCEIRTRLFFGTEDSPLINFMNKRNRFPNSSAEHVFFKDFSVSIRFRTLKMNRTLYSIVSSISAKDNELHELETLKLFRGHSSVESTNVYLVFSQEEVNQLTTQLFSREDHFGFISETFSDILYGTKHDLSQKTIENNFITQNLGDFYKLEFISQTILHLAGEQEVLQEVILGMDEDEVKDKYNKMLSFQLQSKQRDVQCLIGENNCPFPGRDCLSSCQYSIPNFYAISELGRLIWQDIEFIINKFDTVKHDGEREKFLIGHVSRLKKMRVAIDKYGPVVYEFLDLNEEKWNMLLEKLPVEWQEYLQRNIRHLL